MSVSNLRQPRKRGVVGGLLVFGIVVGVLGALLCGGAPGALAPLPTELEPLRGHLTLAGVGLALALVIAFAFVPSAWARMDDRAFFEEICGPRGWRIAADDLFHLRLHGTWHGRTVQIVAGMGRHSPYQNPGQLRIYLSAESGRRVHLTSASRGHLVADLRTGLNLLRVPENLGLVGQAKDGKGALALLAQPGVAAAARRLVDATLTDDTLMLRIEPDAVCLVVYGPSGHLWESEDLDQWLADLETLATGLEALGAPSPPEPASPPEHEQQHNPKRSRLKAALGCGGCATVLLGAYALSAALLMVSELLD